MYDLRQQRRPSTRSCDSSRFPTFRAIVRTEPAGTVAAGLRLMSSSLYSATQAQHAHTQRHVRLVGECCMLGTRCVWLYDAGWPRTAHAMRLTCRNRRSDRAPRCVAAPHGTPAQRGVQRKRHCVSPTNLDGRPVRQSASRGSQYQPSGPCRGASAPSWPTNTSRKC